MAESATLARQRSWDLDALLKLAEEVPAAGLPIVLNPDCRVSTSADACCSDAISPAKLNQRRMGLTMASGSVPTSRDRGRLSPLKLEHAVLRTTALAPMVEWYCTVLEAEVTFGNATIAFLAYDEQNHRLAILARAGTKPRPADTAGLDHLAFTYADLGELIATYERLKDAGITPLRAMDHGSSTSLYYADPDGNGVELKIDNFNSPAEQHAWMRSAEFSANPLGSPIDPEKLATNFLSRQT